MMFLDCEFRWSHAKNLILQSERNLAFEDVVTAIEDGRLLADVQHPGRGREHQRILIVEIGEFVCSVPYVREGDVMFLKTVYRNSKFQRMYQRTP